MALSARVPRYERRTGVTIAYPNNQALQTPLSVSPPSGAQRPRLTFLGTGYLGATYAVCFAEMGYEVLGFDVDDAKIAKLSDGEVPFHEPGLDELLRKNLATARLRFTTSYDEVAEFGDVHFICVGTPQRPDGLAADLSYVETAVSHLAQRLARKALIVGKSTVPVGTAEWVEEIVHRFSPAEAGVEVAWSPEFLQEGFAVEDVLRPNRVIFGVKSEWAQALLYAAHKGVFDLAQNEDREVPVVVTDFATAELVKVAANAFLATKISFINAMAEVCEASGADVVPLAQALALDERIGGRFLSPGLGSLEGRVVGVLGCSFKPNSDDIRDSPALDVAGTVHGLGARVTVYDPAALESARRAHPELEYAGSALEAVRDAHIVLLLTEWPEFADADPDVLGKVVAERNIVDGRNVLDPERWRAASWHYRALGRP